MDVYPRRRSGSMKYRKVHMDEFFGHFLLGEPRPEWTDKATQQEPRDR